MKTCKLYFLIRGILNNYSGDLNIDNVLNCFKEYVAKEDKKINYMFYVLNMEEKTIIQTRLMKL